MLDQHPLQQMFTSGISLTFPLTGSSAGSLDLEKWWHKTSRTLWCFRLQRNYGTDQSNLSGEVLHRKIRSTLTVFTKMDLQIQDFTWKFFLFACKHQPRIQNQQDPEPQMSNNQCCFSLVGYITVAVIIMIYLLREAVELINTHHQDFTEGLVSHRN